MDGNNLGWMVDGPHGLPASRSTSTCERVTDSYLEGCVRKTEKQSQGSTSRVDACTDGVMGRVYYFNIIINIFSITQFSHSLQLAIRHTGGYGTSRSESS